MMWYLLGGVVAVLLIALLFNYTPVILQHFEDFSRDE